MEEEKKRDGGDWKEEEALEEEEKKEEKEKEEELEEEEEEEVEEEEAKGKFIQTRSNQKKNRLIFLWFSQYMRWYLWWLMFKYMSLKSCISFKEGT